MKCEVGMKKERTGKLTLQPVQEDPWRHAKGLVLYPDGNRNHRRGSGVNDGMTYGICQDHFGRKRGALKAETIHLVFMRSSCDFPAGH